MREQEQRLLDRYEGTLLGLALGDALGAPHEGGWSERSLWRVLGLTREGKRRWTDDTQMSLDLAESLVEHGRLEKDDVAFRFAKSYRWSRGYGPGAAKVLRRIRRGADWRQANRSVFPGGSFGNGGAMRAPVVGLFNAHRPEEIEKAARGAAEITHAHPLAIEGATLIARATALASLGHTPREIMTDLQSVSSEPRYGERLALAQSWLDSEPSVSSVRSRLGNGIAALDSVVTAIYLALRFSEESFAGLLRFTRELRGDVDTIGAMAGAIYGAMNGVNALPQNQIARLEQSDRLRTVARALHRSVHAAVESAEAAR